MELDLDHIERIARQRQEAGARVAVRPEVILAMAARIRELESASQPGGGEAEYVLQLLKTAGHVTPSQVAQARKIARTALAAPSAGNGGAEGGSSLAGLRQGNATTPANVDELVPPAAVRADEVDAQIVDARFDGSESDLRLATDANPHDGLRADCSGLHDRQSAENNPATHDAENMALISADSAVISGEPDCGCQTCRPITITDMRMVLCPACGNKRCPHANDRRNDCTGSNEPGQPGSAYPRV